MKRHTFAMEIEEGQIGEFCKELGRRWLELTTFLDEHNIKNFSIWRAERIVFGYYETRDDFSFTEADKKLLRGWENETSTLYRWLSVPLQPMRMMYQDFGIVRENKELIRHRVFVTKLKPGMEEEYKTRHDRLIEERGLKITIGPDSNFSIWYAGGYIFGYDEIDTTMEHEMTNEERQATICWEKGMLEIMDWLTNDVDWISGEYHEPVKRLGWHL